jgi:DNA mismatch repair ATPase MutS
MKAFLMYPDRDFDPQQTLARRDRENRGRRADQGPSLQTLLPWNERELRQDLGLDILLKAMAGGDIFLFEVSQVAVLSGTTNADTIYYRQQVYRDCARHEPIIRQIYQIAIEAIERERKNYWGAFGHYPSATLSRAVDVLQMFVRMLRALRRIADEHGDEFESDGFSRLFAMLRQELSDRYFAEIESHLATLRFRKGVLISAALGKGHKAADYVLRKPHADKRPWLERLLSPRPSGFTFRLHPRDEGGARALSEIRDRGINLVANALAQSADHILSFFAMLRTELAFYVGCLNLHKQLAQLREPICFPEPTPPGTARLSTASLYDVGLALSAGRKVVANDLNADGKDLIVITGANTGGKSTFIRSLGLAQLMMQAGMFVGAEEFEAEVCSGIFTHFRREEDATMVSGKLDEELNRMSMIVDRLTPGAIVLLNESFAATNEREGSQIASQITAALLEYGVKICFVTHLYEFARSMHVGKIHNAIFLRAERHPDGSRTFRMIEGEPLQTSYGRDLYDTVFVPDGPADAGPAPAGLLRPRPTRPETAEP